MQHVSSKASVHPFKNKLSACTTGVAGSGGEASGEKSENHRCSGGALHSREAHDIVHRRLSPEAGSGTGSCKGEGEEQEIDENLSKTVAFTPAHG